MAKGGAAPFAERIATLGGRLDYLTMDEPLWFGHFYKGRNACHETIAEVARMTALDASAIRKVFPAVQIGDTEPMATISPEVLTEWLRAYRAASGHSLAFYQLDVQWNIPWQHLAIAQARAVQHSGIQLGVIYNGSPLSRTSSAWVQGAVRNALSFERLFGRAPQQAIFATWTHLPNRTLPDTNQDTLTGLLLQYVAMHDNR
jgi:hypothetical protein